MSPLVQQQLLIHENINHRFAFAEFYKIWTGRNKNEGSIIYELSYNSYFFTKVNIIHLFRKKVQVQIENEISG